MPFPMGQELYSEFLRKSEQANDGGSLHNSLFYFYSPLHISKGCLACTCSLVGPDTCRSKRLSRGKQLSRSETRTRFQVVHSWLGAFFQRVRNFLMHLMPHGTRPLK